MSKVNLKLISVRLDPETIEKIEKFVESRTYWTRNSVINNILSTVMNDFSEQQIYDMVRRSGFPTQFVDAKYNIIP